MRGRKREKLQAKSITNDKRKGTIEKRNEAVKNREKVDG